MKRNYLQIKRYIKLLNEDDGGGDYGGFGGWDLGGSGGGYGPQWIKGHHLKNIIGAFAAPFIELYAGTKKAIAHTEALIRIGFETIATTLIPVLESDYEDIFKRRDQKVESVNQKYASVRKATYDAFKQTDFLFTAFCCQPAIFLTTPLLLNTPKALYGFVKYAAGDSVSDALNVFASWWQTAKKHVHGDSHYNRYSRYLDNEGKNYSLSKLIVEETKEDKEYDKKLQQFNKEATTKLLEIIKSDEFKRAYESNLKVQHMQKEAQSALISPLEDLFKSAKSAIENVSSKESLNKMSKGKLDSALEKAQEEFKQTKQDKQQSSNGEKRETTSSDQEIDNALVTGAKDTVKKFYINKLTKQIESEASKGIPENHIYIQEAKKIIEKIKSL